MASSSAVDLAYKLGLSITFADLLLARGYGDDERTRRFLDPKLSSLTRPDAMADRGVAVERIVRAIRSGEKIAVFGDYDCDGITSAAIMTEAIRALGGRVDALVGNRFEGGYGLSDAGADRVLETGAGLLVTCDCGSSDHERLERLKRQGIDAVVLDHHLVPEQPLPAVAFLNPHRDDCGYPYKNLASCGLALNLAAGLRAQLRPALDVRQWLDLVAIGTVADMVPLDGDNRVLVRAGMKALRTTPRPGLRALSELARISLADGVSSQTIAFSLAPRLNAPGRLADASLSLDLLLERDANRARELAARVEAVKVERQKIQAKILEEAIVEIEQKGFDEAPALVLGRQGWHPGVVGIVAAQLVERYGKPAIVVGFDGNTGRGSVRGPSQFSVYDLLASSLDSSVSFGGHHAAAGVTLTSLSALERLRDKFNAAVESVLAQAKDSPARQGPDVLLDVRDKPIDVVRNLDWLEPCGVGNPAPNIGIKSARVVRSRSVKGGHLQLTISFGDESYVHGFMAGAGDRAETLPSGVAVNVAGTLGRDTYRGGESVGMNIRCLQVAS